MVPSTITIDSDSRSAPLTRAVFRTRRPGPESDLVCRFLLNVQLRVSNDCRVTVFVEPKLDRSYPDIVFVAWRPSITKNWRPERRQLGPLELRLLHYLVDSGECSEDDLTTFFGSSVRGRLSTLADAGLVTKLRRSYWRSLRLSSI